MKKVLLTGGLGFFCTRFSARYNNEFEILSTDKDDLDITDKVKVMEAFKKFKPDYVIHAAAITVTDFCNNHPEIAYKINVDGAINVAKACKNVGAKIVFISTEQVFNGNKEKGPYSEEDKPISNTVYGKNKLEAEKFLSEILDELWILRFTWLFGMSERGFNINANIMWNTVKALLKGEKIYASPYEFRGMTYITQMIENMKKVFDIPYGLYHAGSKNENSRYDIVKRILIEMGLESRIDEILVKDESKYNENSPRDLRLNTEKAREHGLVFTTTEEGIKDCIRDYKLDRL